jgi:hypothetical protein
MRFRTRWTPSQGDSYLFEFLTATYGDPQKDLVTFSSSVRLNQQLSGQNAVQGYYPFDGLETTYQSRATEWLYTAYVDLNRPLPGLYLRAGRQVLENLPESVPMDGGSVWLKIEESVTLGGFGGIPVNLFESSPAGDAMGGGWAEVTPWARGRVRAEYLHIQDQTAYGNFKNDLAALSLEQGFGSVLAYARYTFLDGQSRDILGRVTGSIPDAGLIVSAQVTYLFQTVQALSYAIDPYSIFMMSLEPYVDVGIHASESVGPFGVDANFTTRQLVRGATEETYNHSFNHFNITPHLDNWPLDHVTLSVTGDWWQATGLHFWTAGGDLSWRITPLFTLSLGTSYSLYSVDVLSGQENDRVRLYYALLHWKLDPVSSLELRFAYEQNSIDSFSTVEVGVRRAF